MAEAVKLGKHEGRDILATPLIIRGTGDGLSAAMDLDPVVLKIGDRVGVYLEGDVVDLHFPSVKGTNGVNRTAVVKADIGFIVEDRSAMAETLDEQRERAALKAEEDIGVQRFPDIEGGDES